MSRWTARRLTSVDPLDIVVDVGGVYDPAKQRYDHHQRGFTEVFGAGGYDRTKLSSAGLVYKHFGKHIIAKQLGVPENDPKVETLWLHLYGEMIESIDGIDNGINIAQGELAYAQRTDLSSRVRRLNPRWNEPASDDDYDAKFAVASKVTGEEFLQQLDYFANAWLPARDVVKAALESRYDVDPSGKIVVFKQVNEVRGEMMSLTISLPRGRTTSSRSSRPWPRRPRFSTSSTPSSRTTRTPSGASSVSPSRPTASPTASLFLPPGAVFATRLLSKNRACLAHSLCMQVDLSAGVRRTTARSRWLAQL